MKDTENIERTIIDDWDSIKIPTAPKVEGYKLNSSKTALLVLDILYQNCSLERRPRGFASIPRIKKLIEKSRKNGLVIVYSLFPNAQPSDIFGEIKPLNNEPILISGPDKFINTDLENILKNNGIETIIIVGTAAHGAVLNTASSAALKGFNVIVPIDGMSADIEYVEQYTAWHLVNAPIIGSRVKLSLCNLIE